VNTINQNFATVITVRKDFSIEKDVSIMKIDVLIIQCLLEKLEG